MAGLAALYLRDSRVRTMEAEARQREAEERRMVEKRNNDSTQAAILRLMNELQDIADGDLTKQATRLSDVVCTADDACVTCSAVCCTRPTSSRSSSTV